MYHAHFFYVTGEKYYVMVSKKTTCTKFTKMLKAGKSYQNLSTLHEKVINIKNAKKCGKTGVFPHL